MVSLPPQVLALLGDDATPETAIRAASRGVEIYADRLEISKNPLDARYAWNSALAAAAIRECEARRAWAEASEARADGPTLQARHEAHDAAWAAYDALRNWRKP